MLPDALQVNNLSALGVLLLCSGTSEASKLREILTEIATMVTSIKVGGTGNTLTAAYCLPMQLFSRIQFTLFCPSEILV